jgi:hypothetical protein
MKSQHAALFTMVPSGHVDRFPRLAALATAATDTRERNDVENICDDE